jgi:polysaccharide biosynthesis/export protein
MNRFFRTVAIWFAALAAGVFAVPAVAQDASSPDAGYILGPGDVIEVSVLGQSEFATRTRIRADGSIVLPFVGSTVAAGDNPVNLAKKIGSTLKAGGFYANPIVSVEVASYASRYVIVNGAVAQPGLQPVDRAYRVSEIVARSGGLRADSADYVVVIRANGEKLRLPFEKLAAGTKDEDPFVDPGDKLFVPAAELYYVYGQINAPGAYPVKDQMTLRMAVARGGGLTQLGSEKKISVVRGGKKQPLGLDAIIQPDDVIVVGERVF